MSERDPSTLPDDEQITSEFPVVQVRLRDSSMVWIAAGVVIGIVILTILFALGGGSEPSGGREPSQPTPTGGAAADSDRPPAGGAPPPDSSRPSSTTLRVEAQDAEGVFVDVRRGSESGRQLFTGVIPAGESREFSVSADRTLWLQLAWAPSALVEVNGIEQDTSGGTESYLVTPAGLERIEDGSGTG